MLYEVITDAVQDALLSAWDKRHQFERGARLDTWIHRIAVNAALQLLRKQHPNRWEPLEEDIRDDSMTPEAAQIRITSYNVCYTKLLRTCTG